MGTVVHMTEEELILMLEDEEEACEAQKLVTIEGSIKEGGRCHVVQDNMEVKGRVVDKTITNRNSYRRKRVELTRRKTTSDKRRKRTHYEHKENTEREDDAEKECDAEEEKVELVKGGEGQVVLEEEEEVGEEEKTRKQTNMKNCQVNIECLESIPYISKGFIRAQKIIVLKSKVKEEAKTKSKMAREIENLKREVDRVTAEKNGIEDEMFGYVTRLNTIDATLKALTNPGE